MLTQFLAGAAAGDWRGFARAGIAWQDLTNPALRESLGLAPGETGIRLTRVLPHGSAGGILKPGDVVLELGGAKLDPAGYYEHPLYGRMLFALLFSDGRRPGETMPVKLLRDGQRLELQLALRAMRPEQDRVPPYVYGRGPDYVIEGGLVFQELTRPYLGSWGDWSRRASQLPRPQFIHVTSGDHLPFLAVDADCNRVFFFKKSNSMPCFCRV